MIRVTILGLGLIFAVTLPASAEEEKNPTYHSIDIQPKSNFNVTGENQLQEISEQDHVWDGIPVTIGAEALMLRGKHYADYPPKIAGIEVDRKLQRLHFIHSAKRGGSGHRYATSKDYQEDGSLIGQYQIFYEDDFIEVVPIVYGGDVRDWWDWDALKPVTTAKLIWFGETPDSRKRGFGVRLFCTTWENPRPDKKIVSITMVSVGDAVANPYCVAMTAEVETPDGADENPPPAEEGESAAEDAAPAAV